MSMKVAVVGVGHLGRHHARIYEEMESTELCGVVDIRQDRAEEIAQAQAPTRKATRKRRR